MARVRRAPFRPRPPLIAIPSAHRLTTYIKFIPINRVLYYSGVGLGYVPFLGFCAISAALVAPSAAYYRLAVVFASLQTTARRYRLRPFAFALSGCVDFVFAAYYRLAVVFASLQTTARRYRLRPLRLALSEPVGRYLCSLPSPAARSMACPLRFKRHIAGTGSVRSHYAHAAQ